MQLIKSHVGVIGSGKSYRCALDKMHDFVQVDFKDSLITMCEDVIGYKIENYEHFKSTVVGFNGSEQDNFCLLRKHPEMITGRKLLQKLGTEVVRKIDKDYWINSFKNKIDKISDKNICVADARFENEFKFLMKLPSNEYNVEFYFCNYKSERYNPTACHESEKLYQKLLLLAHKYNLKDGDRLKTHVLDELIWGELCTKAKED